MPRLRCEQRSRGIPTLCEPYSMRSSISLARFVQRGAITSVAAVILGFNSPQHYDYRIRELATFDLAIDSKLRACNLVESPLARLAKRIAEPRSSYSGF